MTTPIPQPPAIPFIGNVKSIDAVVPINSYMLLTKQYGEIYKLDMLGQEVVVITSVALAQEVLDEKRFHKTLSPPLIEVDNLGTGLFTAKHGDPRWGIAHRILMPIFGPLSIRGMFDDMYDILSQLCLKWERFGPMHPIEASSDFSRLTFDTISLCAYNYRLNNFYSLEDPPFVKAMGDYLVECLMRSRRPNIVQAISYGAKAKYAQDMAVMQKARLANEIIEDRKKHPIEKNDLLNAMLHAKDPQTGEGLTDKEIQAQMLTFLIAGHETTSGMLAFAMTHIINNPKIYGKVRHEVDTVLGKEPMKPEHLSKLPYITAVLRESLRVTPSIAQFTVGPYKDEVIGNGKYLIKKGALVNVLAAAIGKDPAVWGEDADVFNPERMLDGKFEAMPPKSWIPFGNGARACIGKPLAWQEGVMCLATIFQKFDFTPADPSYSLHLVQTLTLKPKNFAFHAIPREGAPSFSVAVTPTESKNGAKPGKNVVSKTTNNSRPLYVLYGSNTGSCESFAQDVASGATTRGFRVTIGTLNSVTGRIPQDGPVIIITASFEGEPADNAAQFVEVLTANGAVNLKNVSYAVFGAGNHDWVHTYQRVPRLIDTTMEKRGAKRLLERGEGDAGGEHFISSFEEWEDKLWTVLSESYGIDASKHTSSVEVELVGTPTERSTTLRQPDSKLGIVVENRVLTAEGAPVKRHIEIELPEDVSYQSGDYLAVLPSNPPEYVRRALARFKISPEQEITISAAGPTTLPTGKRVSVSEVLSGFVEIGQPASQRNISVLLEHAEKSTTRTDLEVIVSGLKDGKPLTSSVLELLEKYEDINLSLGLFLSLLPAMRLRQYSISSSPLWSASHVTLTVGVVSHGQFLGVASNYLANLRKGDRVQLAVRPSNKAFHPPSDPSVSMVMFAAGSGMAPFRGFIQERAVQAKAGRQVGKCVLFFGCRHPDEDYLYNDRELKEWSELGVVDVLPAFSRAAEKSNGHKYIQDRIWAERGIIREYYANGAKFYTCGGSHIATAVREACTRIISEGKGGDEAAIAEVWKTIQAERYATDVFG
ncbi:cytochrome P450 family protein [Ceratobasidium sp. AG-Ba]|nr:cytochrome P450 family protein [Ceratobasidium sp. AG-Ba]QRW06796.1 cytochrome P450 family protein [Ceratobasidium sp. AG-Ba]